MLFRSTANPAHDLELWDLTLNYLEAVTVSLHLTLEMHQNIIIFVSERMVSIVKCKFCSLMLPLSSQPLAGVLIEVEICHSG